MISHNVVVKIICDVCKARAFNHTLKSEQVERARSMAREFALNQGWSFVDPSREVCPDCVAKKAAADQQLIDFKSEEVPDPIPSDPPPPPPPPPPPLSDTSLGGSVATPEFPDV